MQKSLSILGNYGDLRTVRHTSPSPSRTSTLSKQTKVTNVHTYPMEVIETTTPEINPEILASLDPNLLPTGNTKVTTTIKTYTYEIPGTGYPSQVSPIDTDKYIYSPNQSQTTPSKSFIYNKVENNTLTRNVTDNAPLYQKPSPPVIGNDGTIIKETVTTRNYQPGYSPDHPPNKHTYIYNETTTTKNINENGRYPSDYPVDNQRPIQGRAPHDTYIIKETHNTTNTVNQPYPTSGSPYHNRDLPQSPPRQDTYIIKETHNTNVINDGYPRNQPHYPSNNPPNTTYIYKEMHNTNTTVNPQNPPTAHYPIDRPKNTTIIYKTDTHTTNVVDRDRDRPFPKDDAETFDPNYPPYPNAGKGRPNEPINVSYKYSSHSTTTNKYKGGYPNEPEREPLLQPKPFPRDDTSIDGPPKKLDDLMANIGHEVIIFQSCTVMPFF